MSSRQTEREGGRDMGAALARGGRPKTGGLILGVGLVALSLLGGCSSEPLGTTTTPLINHGAPNESEAAQESCIACHACGADDAPLIDRGHAICTECHGPAPDFVAEIPEGGGCGFKMDCSKTPPQVNCWTECHGRHTLRETNQMCEDCHFYAEGQ
ncbi:MAG: hypothetical protein RBU45_11835 [Myxococcota bacterium]|nr:hypothetical protein [Myxococcota bacterium]